MNNNVETTTYLDGNDIIYSDWIKKPIHTGSVYIKPTINKRSFKDTIYVYIYYFCCCGFLDR